MRFLFLILNTLLLTHCSESNPVKPQNRSPVILSVKVFPSTITSVNDSLIVICEAMDPDGDSLFYDWLTDAKLTIKSSNYRWLFHTKDNTHVFYPTEGAFNFDVAWVQCSVRDGVGGGTGQVVTIKIKEDKNE